MEIMEIARMTSKGQVTIPLRIRDILKLEEGSMVMFKVTEKGIYLTPCEVKESNPYSEDEWRKIDRLVAEKGKRYESARAAKKRLKSIT